MVRNISHTYRLQFNKRHKILIRNFMLRCDKKDTFCLELIAAASILIFIPPEGFLDSTKHRHLAERQVSEEDTSHLVPNPPKDCTICELIQSLYLLLFPQTHLHVSGNKPNPLHTFFKLVQVLHARMKLLVACKCEVDVKFEVRHSGS